MPSKGCLEIGLSWHSSVKRKAKRTFLFIVRKKTGKYWFCYTIKLLLRQIICHFAKLTSVNVVVKKHGSVSSFFVAQLMARGSISDLTHKKAVMWIGFGDFLHTLLIKCFFSVQSRGHFWWTKISLKFRYSEKVIRYWKNLPQCQKDFWQILWPS